MRKVLGLVGLLLLGYAIVCFVWGLLMTVVVLVDGSFRNGLGGVIFSFLMYWITTAFSGGVIWEMSLDPNLLWMFDVLCVPVSTILLYLLYKWLIPKLSLRYVGILAFGVAVLLLFYINTIKPTTNRKGEGSTAAIGRSTEGGIFPHWFWMGE